MNYWLKLIGTLEDPVTEYSEDYIDYSVHHDEWIVYGDKIILYATGQKIIFASANVVSEPYASGQQQWPVRVNIDYRHAIPIDPGIEVMQIADSGHNLLLEVQHRSFIPISEDEFNRGDNLLQG